MKAKINKKGVLEIWRGGEYRPQACPYATSGGKKNLGCGDWCPMFGEPRVNAWDTHSKVAMLAFVDLCNKQTLEFDEFIDERQGSTHNALLDGKKAAEYVGIQWKSLYKSTRNGRIPCQRIGRGHYYKLEDLDNYRKYVHRQSRVNGNTENHGRSRHREGNEGEYIFEGSCTIRRAPRDD